LFDKETNFRVIDTHVFSNELIKSAAPEDLPEPFDPEFLYVKVRAISSGEFWGPNKNADYFPEAQLIQGKDTFLDAHVFKNHENKDVAKAIGSVLLVEWNAKMHYVSLLIKVDRKLAPEIVRGFEKNYSTDVSMGCRVSHTQCSVCGNKAKVRAEFCKHVNTMRNNILPDGTRVYEVNYNPRFHDISVVLNGADRTAKLLEKVASYNEAPISPNTLIFPLPEEEVFSEYENIIFAKAASVDITKVADFKKIIMDKIYTLALLRRLAKNKASHLSDEVDATIKEAKADFSYQLSKTAGLSPSSVPALLGGTLGIGLLTNYYQGKRLRGEQLNGVQDFVADNPGVLPIAYLVGARPMYKAIGKKLGKLNEAGSALITPLPKAINASPSTSLVKKAGFDYTELFTKEATDNLNLNITNCIDVFSSTGVAKLLKNAYHYTDAKLDMVKLALIMYEAGREDIVNHIQNKHGISSEDINNFVYASLQVADNFIQKEAGVGRGMLEDSLFVKPGMIAAGLPAMLIDGYLINKLLGTSPSTPSEKTKSAVNGAGEVVTNLQIPSSINLTNPIPTITT